MSDREPKKTTTIEVRVSDAVKAAFLERRRQTGQSATARIPTRCTGSE